MISAPSFAAAAAALQMMSIGHAAAADLPITNADLTCNSDETKMTTGSLTSCLDSDGSCETKCNSAACSGSGKLEYEYIVPVGGDVSIDCSATEGARCCLNGFFGTISNTGNSSIGGTTTCDTTDEVMLTEASLFCDDTVYDRCFIECSDGCTVTSPNSNMTKMTYFATETPQGEDFKYMIATRKGIFAVLTLRIGIVQGELPRPLHQKRLPQALTRLHHLLCSLRSGATSSLLCRNVSKDGYVHR